MFEGRKILFVSKYGGFAGGIERYIYQTTALLRSAGAEVWGAFSEPSRNSEKFLSVFNHVCQPGVLPTAQFDLAAVHKIMNMDFLRKFLDTYQARAALYVHDHDYYCPRSFKYYPFRRINCHRRYSRFVCGLCGMVRSPRHWSDGVFAEIEDKTTLFQDRLDILRRFPHVVVISSFMRDNLFANSFSPETLHVIPPCVPLPERRPPRPASERPVILFVGQLIRGKGCDIFLRVLSRLKRPYRARILGDGIDRVMLQELTESLGLTSRVEFCGWATPPDVYFAEADLVLLPFRWQEPFGLVVAESASWGLPVVAYNLGGVSESLEDGKNGFSIKFGDIATMASRTDQLLADHTLRLKMGANGRQMVAEKFSKTQFFKGFKRLLDGGGF